LKFKPIDIPLPQPKKLVQKWLWLVADCNGVWWQSVDYLTEKEVLDRRYTALRKMEGTMREVPA